MEGLFGYEIDPNAGKKKVLGPIQQLKRSLNYRKGTKDGPRCETCINLRAFDYHGKKYYKCCLIGCTHSEATDIRLSDVCREYSKRKTEEELRDERVRNKLKRS